MQANTRLGVTFSLYFCFIQPKCPLINDISGWYQHPRPAPEFSFIYTIMAGFSACCHVYTGFDTRTMHQREDQGTDHLEALGIDVANSKSKHIFVPGSCYTLVLHLAQTVL